jgi:hypothetical protein
MVIKHGTSIQGSEQTGAEESQIQAARKFGQMASNAGALGVAAVTAGAGLIKDALKRRKKQMDTEPELRGDFYKDLQKAFISNGVSTELAGEAAADLVQNKDAESSEAIAEANRIISESVNHQPIIEPDSTQYVQSENNPLQQMKERLYAFRANEQGHESISFLDSKTVALRQHLTKVGVSTTEIRDIEGQRKAEITAAETAAFNGTLQPGDFLPKGENSFEDRLSRTDLPENIRTELIKEFYADVTAATERGERDLFTDLTVENSPTAWELEGYETYDDYYRDEVEPEQQAQRESQSTAELADAYQVPTTAEAIAPKKGVEFSKKPSEMKWPELQKTARAITDETGQKPASNKKADVEPFVTTYWDEQQAELRHESQAIASPPIIRVPIQKADTQTGEGLGADLSAELEARGADSAIAAEAGPALVKSQDAKTNPAIAEANSQVKRVVERSRLHQTYYNVLAKQKILSSQLTELASKDLAAGKGAHSSPYIRQAFDKILDKELEKSGLDLAAQKWSKYSRHVTEQDPIKRDYLIATAAMKDGVSAKDAKSIIRWNSPVAAGINQKDGGTAMANYADKVVSNLKGISKGVQARSAKNMALPQRKKVGIEV